MPVYALKNNDDFKGISVQVDIYIDPKDVPEYLEIFKPFLNLIIQEAELTYFEVFQEADFQPEQPDFPGDRGHLRFIECFSRDTDWFLNTLRLKPYIKEYEEATDKYWVKPRTWLIYDRLGSELTHWNPGDDKTSRRGRSRL
ncbi:hypothetical protein ACLMJK_002853 [Lecanora helva]